MREERLGWGQKDFVSSSLLVQLLMALTEDTCLTSRAVLFPLVNGSLSRGVLGSEFANYYKRIARQVVEQSMVCMLSYHNPIQPPR